MSYGSHTGYGYTYGEVSKLTSYDFELSVDDSSHIVSSTSPSLIPANSELLSVDDAYHIVYSDEPLMDQQYILNVQDAVHGVDSQQVSLINNFSLVVDNSTHSVQSPKLTMTTFGLLRNVASTVHSVTSDTVTLAANNQLIVHNSVVGVTDDFTRIINWANYNKYYGNYIEVSGETGDFI